MKRIHYYIGAALAAMTLLLGACDSEQVYYEGGSYVLFSDTLLDMPITKGDTRLFDVTIGTTTATDYDRYYVVDVDMTQTNAIEGYHFDLLNRNVRIAAGERTGKVTLRGHYDHMEVGDSLAVTLRLLGTEGETLSCYSNSANIRLYKCMPFCIDDYVGNLKMRCTFPFSTAQITTFVIQSEKKNDSTLVLIEPFDTYHNLELNFHTAKDNPFDNDIDVKEQIAFTDLNYGEIAMSSIEGIPSYYLPFNRAFILYVNAFVPRIGSLGAYWYIFEWITAAEADAITNGISSPY